MNREAEEFRISSDIKQANLEVLRDQLNEAFELLQGHAKHGNTQGWRESVAAFIAAQQGEQCQQCGGSGSVSDSDGCGVWYIDCPSCTKKHLKQAEGAQGEREDWSAFDNGVDWSCFPGYLIDHCEGDTITEEGLQYALSAMLKDEDYLRIQSEKARSALAQPSTRKSHVAEALRAADWSNTCIGNKALIEAAIEHLEAQPSPKCATCHDSEMVFTDEVDHNGHHIEVDCPDCAQPSPAPELERPEVVAWQYEPYLGGEHYGKPKLTFVQPHSTDRNVEPLMTVAQHERILRQALGAHDDQSE